MADPVPTYEQMVDAELESYQATGELPEGGAKALRGAIVAGAKHLPRTPEAVGKHVHDALHSGLGSRYLNPEFRAPEAPGGGEASPLRRALQRHAGRLDEGQVEELAGAWAGDAAGKTPAQIAGMVAGRLAARGRSAPPGTARIDDVLNSHFGDRTAAERADAARSLGRDSTTVADHTRLIKAAAFRIGVPSGDPRRQGRAADGTRINPDGSRFRAGPGDGAGRTELPRI